MKAKATSMLHTGKTDGRPSPRKTNQKQADEKSAWLAAIVQSSDDAIIGKTLDGMITSWNQGAQKIYGYTAEEAVGQPISILIPPHLPDALPAILDKLKRGERINRYETLRIRKDGSPINVSLTISPIRNADGELIGASTIARDITERIRAEKKIVQLKRLYATLSQVNQMIVRVKERDELFQTICNVAAGFGEFALAWVGILDEDSGDVRPVAAHGLNIYQWPFPIVNIHREEYSESLTSLAIRTSKVMTSENIQSTNDLTPLSYELSSYPYHATAVIPFRLRNKVVGILALISQENGLFNDKDEIPLLDEMGMDISFALDNMQNEKERKLAEEQVLNISKFPAENPNPVLRISLDGVLLYANQGSQSLLKIWACDVGSKLPAELVEVVATVSQDGISKEIEINCENRVYSIWLAPVPDAGYVNGYGRDITEAKKALEKLRKSEERFRLLFDNNHIVMMLIEPHSGAIRSANKAAAKFYGYSVPELCAMNINDINQLAPEEVHTERMLALKEARDYFNFPHRLSSGEIRSVEVYSAPIQVEGNTLLFSIVNDITERVRAEKKIIQLKRLYATLSQVNQMIVRAADRDELFQTICNIAITFGEFSVAWIGLLDESAGNVQPLFASGMDITSWPLPIVNIYSGPLSQGLVAQALQTSAVAISEDAQVEQRLQVLGDPLREQGFHSSAVIPFRVRGKSVGTLTLLSREIGLFQDIDEVRLLDEMGLDISFALDNMENEKERKGAEEAVRSRSRQLEALLQASRSLTESLNLPDVLQGIVDKLTDILEVETSAIYLVDGESLYLGASAPPLPAAMPEELRQASVRDHPHIAEALASGQTISVSDAQSEALTAAERQARENLGLRTVVYIPVTTKQDSIAVLLLGSVGKSREFTAEEINLANAVSNQAALAITNAKLYEDVAQQVQQLEAQIAERKKAEEALKHGEHVLRLFVEHSPASIAMFDRDMRYIVASNRYLIDYDLPPQDLTGRSHYDVFPEIPEYWKEIHRRCLAGAVEKADEDPFPRANGKMDWVRWEVRPWYEETGRIGGVILFSEVITERKEIQDELRRLNDVLEQRVLQRTMELSQANRAKDEFLANMSHELRTPLNTVLGLSESLLEQGRGPLNEKQVQSIELISSSGQHLLGLINDILEVSKIEAGKLQLKPSLISLKELCESSLNFIKELAQRKQITVEFKQETSLSRVHADPQRLKQILINLLNNAVKFTPEKGKVCLEVRTNTEADRILLSIIDTGIGIAEEDLKRLFTPFTQLDSSLSRQYAGTGLGLALVQRLTELHGGSVEVESAVGQGSRFTIILPLNESMQEQTPEKQVDSANAEQRPAFESTTARALGTILLAEDNLINSEMVSEYLSAHGYLVIAATDGIEVLEKAAEFLPDLILMDIQMPTMDGLEATRRLRSDPRFFSTPIIALTALAMPGDKERCLEAGVNEYLSKPVSLKRLISIIANLTGSVT